MNHLSLFNGIGGFQLAAHWAGWNNVAHVEIDNYCNKVVAQHFPESKCYLDIKEFNGTEYNGTIDIISGGFPCQPYSAAGKRKGKEDDRHLWPEMLRIISEVQPRWVVGENVRGLTNWNGGLVFDEVQADLEAEGFEVWPYVLPACAVNAPHRRDRIWFVAYARLFGQEKRQEQPMGIEQLRKKSTITNTKRKRQSGQGRPERQISSKENENRKASWSYTDGRWPTQSPVCGRNDGIPNRVDRLKALGNAIVPQVAFEIFKAINLYEFSQKLK